MDDWLSVYNVTAPPSSTIFSRADGGAIFPNFDDPAYRCSNGTIPADPAAALRSFMSDLFQLHFRPEFFVQCRTAAAFLIVLVGIAAAIVIRRAWEGSLWVARIVRKPDGALIVPNSIVIFSLLEGLYGIVLATWLFLIPRWFNSEWQDSPVPASQPAWVCLSWCPLIAGAFWASWGVWHAVPSETPHGQDHRLNKAGHLRPAVINILCLGSPLIVTVAVASAAIPSWVYYGRALRSYRVWQGQYANQTQLSHDMLQNAQDIWATQLHGIYLISIGFVLWCIAAFSVTCFYSCAGYRLLRAVSKQIETLRSVKGHAGPATPSQNTNTSKLQTKASLGSNMGVPGHDESFGTDGDGTSSEGSEDRNKTFFPPVRPSAIKTMKASTNKRAVQAADGPRRRTELQAQFLEKIRRNFLVQWIAKGLAEMCFTGLAIYVTSSYYAATESNQVAPLYERSLLWATWTSVLFGAITLFCIAQQVYEPVFDSFTALNDENRRHGRSHKSLNRLARSQNRSDSAFNSTNLESSSNGQSESWIQDSRTKRTSTTFSDSLYDLRRPYAHAARADIPQDTPYPLDMDRRAANRRSDIIILADETKGEALENVEQISYETQPLTLAGVDSRLALATAQRVTRRGDSLDAKVARSPRSPTLQWTDRERNDSNSSWHSTKYGRLGEKSHISPSLSSSALASSSVETSAAAHGLRKREESETSILTTVTESAITAKSTTSRRHSYFGRPSDRDFYWSTAALPEIPAIHDQKEPWVSQLEWRRSQPPSRIMHQHHIHQAIGEGSPSPQATTPRADSMLDGLDGLSVQDFELHEHGGPIA